MAKPTLQFNSTEIIIPFYRVGYPAVTDLTDIMRKIKRARRKVANDAG